MTDALPSSKLGTQDHWDSVYAREVRNYAELGDEGEVWFGEDAVQRMVDFLERLQSEDEERSGEGDQGPPLHLPSSPSILDVGTGNGHLLFALLELDPPLTPPERMLGIDYSPPSVELCKRIAEARGGDAQHLLFQCLDFLRESSQLVDHSSKSGQGSHIPSAWDIVCDKGTLDAIALSRKDDIDNSSTSSPVEDPVAQYAASLAAITHTGSLFLITSCNFTADELVQIFTAQFSVYHVVPVPSFSFGGQKGSTTVTIAFRRH